MIASLMSGMSGVLLGQGETDLLTRWFFRTPAATDAGRHTDALYIGLWWFCVFWFVFLMALMAYFVVRYRRRKGVPAPVSASHNTPLEIAWTIIPTILVGVIFFLGFDGYMNKMVAPGNAVEMRITGFKWSWKLEYPNGAEATDRTTTPVGFRDVPLFYMPAEVPIKFRMNSQDVMHAFWIPDFRIKMDLLPNRYTSLYFQAEAPDGANVLPTSAEDAAAKNLPFNESLAGVPYTDHWVFCAEYCGTEHSEMAAVIRVIPEDAFNKWVATAGIGNLEPVQIGEIVYKQNCQACHSVDGGANTGPTWKDLYGSQRQFVDGTSAVADENYIRESILYPSRQLVQGYGNNMTSFAGVLSDKQIDGVIAYMKSLSVNAPAEPAAGEGDGEGAGEAPAGTDAPAEGGGQ